MVDFGEALRIQIAGLEPVLRNSLVYLDDGAASALPLPLLLNAGAAAVARRVAVRF